MKRLYMFLLLWALYTDGSSQPLNLIKWDIVRLPINSINEIGLLPIDSLRVICTFTKDSVFIDSLGYESRQTAKYYFETSDGGKTWQSRQDSINGFYGGRKTPYSGQLLPVEKNRRFLLAGDGPKSTLYLSDDVGNTWTKGWSGKGTYRLATTLTKKDVLLFYEDSAKLYRSTDAGVTFSYEIGDNIFSKALWPDSAIDNPLRGQQATIGPYVKKDVLNHTFILGRNLSTSIDSTNVFFKYFPQGLHSFVTTSGGASWKHYVTQIPTQKYSDPVYGDMQYCYNNERLFFFTNYHSEDNRYHQIGGQYGLPNSISGINFFYSDDDGKTWDSNSDHVLRRRAYEGVSKDELWFTLTKNDMAVSDTVEPAYIITRTTDNGDTWEYDSTTLGQFFEQKADGRMIAFSDPRHGWIAAQIGSNTYILRYDANEQPLSVEGDTGPVTYYPMWLYPIPAKDEVQINFLKKGTIQDVEFFDIMGRKVTVPFTMNDNTASASVKDTPSGYYMVRAKLSGAYYARPLIVRK